MNTPDTINSVAHVIQLAVAPVFLLTGVASLLSVLIGRLTRAIDRYRELRRAPPPLLPEEDVTIRQFEMSTLSRRAQLIQAAITLCVVCALLICLVIALLFLGSVYDVAVATAISVLFVTAMATLIAGLLAFLREVFLASRTIPRYRP